MKNEPAFPTIFEIETESEYQKVKSEGGLTKREYFAGLAMSDIIKEYPLERANHCAKRAVIFADAILAELDKTNEQ